MYGRPGVAYVYLIYGMYACLNVVTEPEGTPAAVLIRAVEPVDRGSGEAMRAARWSWWRRRKPHADAGAAASERDRLAALPDARVASGPGLVTAAFDITRTDTGTDLLDPDSSVRIERGTVPARIVATPRIGIAYAAEPWRNQPWRLMDPASPAVSGARARGSAS
jgi:DNA-3-methyladenine glycosylase